MIVTVKKNFNITLYTTKISKKPMPRYERSPKKDSRDSRPRRDGPRRSFNDNPRGRPRRDFNSRGRERREVEMTKVICSECGEECEVPFKPTSSKPVYCKDCFAKKGGSSGKISSKDFEEINEKLDKIIKALKIK